MLIFALTSPTFYIIFKAPPIIAILVSILYETYFSKFEGKVESSVTSHGVSISFLNILSRSLQE